MEQSRATQTDTAIPTSTQMRRSAAKRRQVGTWPRHSRALAAVVVLVLIALVPWGATCPIPMWTAPFHQAVCLGACCVITNGFVAVSCGDYTPIPAALR
jgi:hypothetical protein